MRRLVIFIVLAAGGLLALGTLSGGFRGSTALGPVPVVSEIPPAARAAGSGAPVKLDELPIGGGAKKGGGAREAPIELDPLVKFNETIAEPAVYTDPKNGDQIEIPNAPKAWVTFREASTMRDPAGSPGVRWHGVHIVLFRDKKDYTRADAEALRANPKTGRRGLELYDITADEGYETTAPLPLAPGESTPRGHTVVHLIKNVLIHDFVRQLDMRTSDAVVDCGDQTSEDSATAEGSAPVEVESKAYLVRGTGFRFDCRAQRLEILQNTEFEATDLAGDGAKPSGGETANTMHPQRIQAKGSTVIVRHTEDRDPFTDVRMEGGVHVQLVGGQLLDADSVALRLIKRTADASATSATDTAFESLRLDRMDANGDVRYEGKDQGGALLTARGPTLSIHHFRAREMSSMRLAGRSLVTWRGEMALPGERPSDRIVQASATESVVFAPDAETLDAALLDLVGTARVECGRAPIDATPQRVAADRITVHLRRHAVPPGTAPAATTPGQVPNAPTSEWAATAFSATGGVVLDGPRLSGAAREMKGFDLDRPTYRVTAAGPDAHLEVADDPEPKTVVRRGEPTTTDAATGPSSTASTGAHATGAHATGAAKPARTWLLAGLSARENAMGSLRVRAGEGAAAFAGDVFTFRRESGAEIRAKVGADAHLTLEGREGRDRTVDAHIIYLRFGVGERTLETAGHTRAVFWVGDDEPTTPPSATASNRRVIELRSASRIDISGSRGSQDSDATLSVTLADGGALSARTDGVVTDRLTATSIEMSLVETIPTAGETGFAISGPRTNDTPLESVGPVAATTRPKAVAVPTVSTPPTIPGRFVLTSDSLALVVGTESRAGSAGALRRVHAEGHVKADGDDPKEGPRRFEAERFDYDAGTGRGLLVGTARVGAVVTLGHEPAIDRIVSPRIDVTFRDGRMTRAVFAQPVRGVFHTKPSNETTATRKRTLERYLLESLGGRLTVEGDAAIVDGSVERPVRVERTVRDALDAQIGEPMTITTLRLKLTTSSAFGAPGSTLTGLDADGAGTRIDVGSDPTKQSHAVGDKIRFDRPAGERSGALGTQGVLRITSARGAVIVTKPGSTLLGYDVLYDLSDGTIHAKLKSAQLGDAK